MQLQNIVLALPLEDELLMPLYSWGKRFDWSHVGAVHMVHVVKKNITPLEFGLMEMPDENTFKEMRPTLNKFLADESKKIIPADYKGETHFHLGSHFNPSEEVTNTIRSLRASLVVVSTRGKRGFEGLFHSSFTDHMVRFAPCDVYVVRPA
ncbi:MAG TPA: universal stress protein [Bacteriovoracaceae bacterium]|nr:universal stress protein [Bacteriovoracaceae bacterium]